jgi:2-polyprenyl-3-methyl-5-hydroxy-6-metoxy-1,4-benzoquinol methylase
MMFQDPEQMGILLTKIKESEQYAMCSANPVLATSIAAKTIERIKILFKNGLKDLKVLEIGTGKGNLAALLIENEVNYKGIELSPFLFQEVMRSHPELKGKVQDCPLDEASFQKEYFDLIVIVDTFEHIPYPVEFLEKLKVYLRMEGVLYLEVPNESMLRCKGFLRCQLNTYSGYPTQTGHVSLFKKNTLKRVLKKANLEIAKVYQLSILGDYERMKTIFGNRAPTLIKFVSGFFKLTRIDIFLQQGNLVAVSLKK